MDGIVSLWAFSTCLNSIVASSFFFVCFFNESSALASCYSKEKIENNTFFYSNFSYKFTSFAFYHHITGYFSSLDSKFN